MRFGIRLRRLWHLRRGVAAAAVLAAVLALWTAVRIDLSPPGLTPRMERVSAASLSAVIDTPRSSIVDLRQDTHDIGKLTPRGVVLGTVMTTPEVRTAIARRAGVPPDKLVVVAPMTQPATAAAITRPKGTASIVLRSNATVPLLHLYTEASDTATAERLADAAVSETQAYLNRLAASQDAPENAQLRLVALGRAEGSETTKSVRRRTPVLVFLLIFGAGCATLIFVSRVAEDMGRSPATGRA